MERRRIDPRSCRAVLCVVRSDYSHHVFAVAYASIPTNTKSSNAGWVSSLGPVFRLVADRGCLPHGAQVVFSEAADMHVSLQSNVGEYEPAKK